MITIVLSYWEERAILSIAEKIKSQRVKNPDRTEKHRRALVLVDDHPELNPDELYELLRRSGIYSPSTYRGDILSMIRTHRKRRSREAKP